MTENGAERVLEARGVARTFRQGPIDLRVLDDVNFSVGAGERIAIIGASGSGKTTLLQILGGLDQPTAGTVRIAGNDIHALAEKPRGELRNRTLGFVYQFHHLLPEFSALENVAMPLLVRREPKQAAEQRAAVARALVTSPRIVLADEPTGNLDGANAEAVFALMLELNRESGTSLIVVTHDVRLAARMDRILEIKHGNLVEKT